MPFERIPQILEALEEALAQHHGDLLTACRTLNIKARDVHIWMQADPEVYNRIRAAQMIGWAGLESAAYERAVTGIEIPIVSKGEIIGYKTEYSDSLLAKMLDARVEGYGSKSEGRGMLGSLTVNVAVMPRASSYEEWQEQRAIALQKDVTPTQPQQRVIEHVPQPPTDSFNRADMDTIRERVRKLTTPEKGGLRDVL